MFLFFHFKDFCYVTFLYDAEQNKALQFIKNPLHYDA